MTDQVNSIGVPLDQDEMEDPSTNENAPDPLLDEAPRSGALAAIGSKVDQQGRVAQSRASMDALREQYSGAAGQANDAYAAQKKALQDATQRLMAMSMGPGPQEAAYRIAAAAGTGEPGTGRYNPAGVSTAHADILAQQREAEMAKQQLLTQYGMQIPQAQLGAANQRLNQITQQMRIQQSDLNNASNKADTAPKLLDKYYTPDPNDPSKLIDHPEMRAADVAQAAQVAQNAAKAKLAAQSYAATGMITPEIIDLGYNDLKSLPSAIVRNPTAMSQVLQGIHERAVANGDSARDFWATQQLNKESAKVLDDYSKGKTHAGLDGLNTAVQHINVLKPLVGQLANGNVSIFNTIGNTWDQKVMGKPAPTDFNGVRDFVVGEISKAVLPGGGGEREREALAASASSANSGPALNSIIEKWQELLAGKTQFTKFNWDNATKGRYGAFEDRFLLPATRTALGIAAPAPVVRPGQKAPLSALAQSYLPGGSNYKAPAP
jgi:hypothetical protein